MGLIIPSHYQKEDLKKPIEEQLPPELEDLRRETMRELEAYYNKANGKIEIWAVAISQIVKGLGVIRPDLVLCRTIRLSEIYAAGSTLATPETAAKNSNLHKVVHVGEKAEEALPGLKAGMHCSHIQSAFEPIDYNDKTIPFGWVAAEDIVDGWWPIKAEEPETT